MRRMSRRDALRALGLAAGGSALLRGRAGAVEQTPGKALIASAHRPGILGDSGPDPQTVRDALDACVSKVTGAVGFKARKALAAAVPAGP